MKLQKETQQDRSKASHGKWYGDACGTAFALELLGERWALLIVRELILGARRFTDLRKALPGISAKVLTERLEGLEAAGVLVRKQLPPPAAIQVYELTEWGLLAEPAIQELGRWAARSPDHDATLPLSPVSLMLSLRTMIDHEAARRVSAKVGFRIGDDVFVAQLRQGEMPVRRTTVDEPVDVWLEAPSAPVLAALFYGGVPVNVLERDQGLVVTGERARLARFLELFALPPKCG